MNPICHAGLCKRRIKQKRILHELDETGKDVVECNIAAWQYRDKNGPLLNLQLSERYEPPQREFGQQTIFDVLQKREDGDETE